VFYPPIRERALGRTFARGHFGFCALTFYCPTEPPPNVFGAFDPHNVTSFLKLPLYFLNQFPSIFAPHNLLAFHATSPHCPLFSLSSHPFYTGPHRSIIWVGLLPPPPTLRFLPQRCSRTAPQGARGLGGPTPLSFPQ